MDGWSILHGVEFRVDVIVCVQIRHARGWAR